MPKKSIINRNNRRKELVEKHRKKRTEFVATLKSAHATSEEKWMARVQLEKLPKDSARSRLRNRCPITGRGRGVYSIVGLSRAKFLELLRKGFIPGFRKASW